MFSTGANCGQGELLPVATKRCNGVPKMFGVRQITQNCPCAGGFERLDAVRSGRDADEFAAGRVRGLDIAGRVADENGDLRLASEKAGEAAPRGGRQRLAQFAVFGIGAANELIERNSRRLELDARRRFGRSREQADGTILDRSYALNRAVCAGELLCRIRLQLALQVARINFEGAVAPLLEIVGIDLQ